MSDGNRKRGSVLSMSSSCMWRLSKQEHVNGHTVHVPNPHASSLPAGTCTHCDIFTASWHVYSL
jgi:hypothetical protein